jgi:Kdo2-lipid IVA lauroyltransferase/acyltransferase
MKKIRYLLESLAVRFGLWVFFILGLKNAANIASALARFVGKRVSVNELAYKNLGKAIPNLSNKEKRKIIDDMWDNLGRIIGEYPHVAGCKTEDIDKFIEISPESIAIINQLKDSGKGGLIFSGHIGNWEIGPKAFLKYGLKTKTVYRPLNNPYVEEMTAQIRGVELIEKSASGNRKILEAIRKKEFVIIMADQKVTEGERVKFFHDYATTTTSLARIALKYDIALIPARSIRVNKDSKFIVEVEKPLEFTRGEDLELDILKLTRKINLVLERWIKEYPAQWFWVHNRWKK